MADKVPVNYNGIPKTNGLPPGGNGPVYHGYAPLLPVGRSTNMNEGHTYDKPVEPVTGRVPLDQNGARPGVRLPQWRQQLPPRNLYNGSMNRQKGLEAYELTNVGQPISGPSTEVVRPVQELNYQLPNPRWTGRIGRSVFSYTREFAKRFATFNDGTHFSMARFTPLERPQSTRTMNRNTIVPRNVPQPLDDQIVSKSNRSDLGSVFASYGGYVWK